MKRALLVPFALAGAVLALLFTALPRPSANDVIAARVLGRLESMKIHGSVVRIGGAQLHATCTRRKSGSVVTFDDRTRLLVHRTQVHVLRTPRTLAASDSELMSAEADLGGTRPLYVEELTNRLMTSEAVVARAYVAGRPSYRLRLDGSGARVDLYVTRSTLVPIAVDYVSRRLSGTATLLRGKGC